MVAFHSKFLGEMARAYATACTYADRGVVSTIFIKPSGRREDRRPFLTYFERPSRFRFEFQGGFPDTRLVIWQNGGVARSFWTLKNKVEETPLDLAIAGATGISGGSANTIPALLLPTLFGGWRHWIMIPEPCYEGEDLIQDTRCHRLSGRVGDREMTLWLDVEQHLIRRIFTREHFGAEQHARMVAQMREDRKGKEGLPTTPPLPKHREDFDTETTTSYEPHLGGPIDPAVFDFVPPA